MTQLTPPNSQKAQDSVLGAVAFANAARPGLIEVIPSTPAEAQVYKDAFVNARLALARQPSPAAMAPRRVNSPAGRPRAAAARSSAKSGDSGDDDPPLGPPIRGGLRDTYDRLRVLQRDLKSAKALLRENDLAAVRLVGAIDVLDRLIADLERFGVAA